MTSDTGAWRQTIFYPYMHAATLGQGTVLNTIVKSPVYEAKQYGEAPYLDCVVVENPEKEELVVRMKEFLSLKEPSRELLANLIDVINISKDKTVEIKLQI